jgi:hypothetical protein
MNSVCGNASRFVMRQSRLETRPKDPKEFEGLGGRDEIGRPGWVGARKDEQDEFSVPFAVILEELFDIMGRKPP